MPSRKYCSLPKNIPSNLGEQFCHRHLKGQGGPVERQGYEVKNRTVHSGEAAGPGAVCAAETPRGDNYPEKAIRQCIRDHKRTPLYRWFRSPPKSCYKFKSRPKKLTGFRALSYRVPRWANSKGPQLFRKTAVQSGRGHYVGTLCCAGQTTDEVQGGHLGSIFILNRTLQGKMDALADQRKTLYCQKLRYPQNAPLSAFNPFKRTGRSYGYTPGSK